MPKGTYLDIEIDRLSRSLDILRRIEEREGGGKGNGGNGNGGGKVVEHAWEVSGVHPLPLQKD